MRFAAKSCSTRATPGAIPPLKRKRRPTGTALLSVKLLPGTRLVRAFSAVDATQIKASFERETDRLAVPLASDDAEAMRIAEQLVRDAGCEPVIVGKLAE